MAEPREKPPLKMRDLERRTGVNRETIRVYLREGLLPEPKRPKPNVAEYNETHVRGILAIRELQHERHLSLPQIKQAMTGNLDAMPADPSAYPHLDTLLASRMGVDDALIPLKNLCSRHADAMADASALASIGAVKLHEQEGELHLSPTDAQIVGLWGDMRKAGFTEELGFTPQIASFYIEAAQELAEEEVAKFLSTLDNRLDRQQTAALAQSALNLMLPFFGLLRMKAVLEAFAKRNP